MTVVKYEIHFRCVTSHEIDFALENYTGDWLDYCERSNGHNPDSFNSKSVNPRSFGDFCGWLGDLLAEQAADDMDVWNVFDIEIESVETRDTFDFDADDFLDLIEDPADPNTPPRPGPGQLDIFGNETPSRTTRRQQRISA
jgi:hypothetical protein